MKYLWNHSLDDIVFEGRNQSYGAYTLRQDYHKRLLVGLLASPVLFLLLCALPAITESLSDIWSKASPDESITVLEHYSIPVDEVKATPLPPKMQEPLPPKKAMIRLIPPRVDEDDRVAEEEIMPEVDELAGKVISTTNQDGQAADNLDPDDIPPLPNVPEEAEREEEEDLPVDLIGVEQYPEFPGGEKAMFKWLSDRIKYPEQLKGTELEMTIVAGFVIGKDGSVSEVRLLRGGNQLLEKVVLEAISEMPAWKPAKQNGKIVKCRFTLPVRFHLE